MSVKSQFEKIGEFLDEIASQAKALPSESSDAGYAIRDLVEKVQDEFKDAQRTLEKTVEEMKEVEEEVGQRILAARKELGYY